MSPHLSHLNVAMAHRNYFRRNNLQILKLATYSTAGGKVSCVPRYPTVSHKFPRDILCPVVIRSISENFCDYHGTWMSSRYNHRNFQTWVITTELSGHDVSRGNLWDTVGYRETRGNFTTSSTVYIQRLKITVLGANWQPFRLERIAKCSYFILSTQNIKFYWFVVNLKKFMLPIWWCNEVYFLLGINIWGIRSEWVKIDKYQKQINGWPCIKPAYDRSYNKALYK